MKKNIGIILVVLFSVFILLGLGLWYFAPSLFQNGGYPYYGHMIGGWGMPFGMIGMGIFWFAALYFIFNGFGYREECRNSNAIETLKKRLAKGDISIEEYEKMIDKLKENK
ncbi:MAG: hypothetical protein A2Y45_08805 [Tenericutes bacterium GWC2_34_14]|nr:MAG: hypothetical protein A2Z84_04675 [Tenericutes bacterium GWA2_35_7]OHE29992.1 MAG: hypothetical protein A2Y45_08805 [Tenericutes bacterium GWC2_34_14]OHE34971.1 MAG: hypothetical protein A2012_02415 [Tenericutes bacterium GWE2_34_108]OHE37169.1 MAG: hypothetical protein A2Y46_00595 [Tenericutes bacterium GWF1_35_14]OHE39699.1 MAG: hypothetical protein A2Y44_02265 [Tenericutes bacterium GWF2_35_184]OHE44113.1 MAG: hypothetical protein A2221_03245 [Tenericutes bacterium RIFOXYA2_FULL_36_3